MSDLKANHRYTRREDMSPSGSLTVIFQADGDGVISITDEYLNVATVEFCSPFAGGGRSSNTLKALRDLALAIEKDNSERPIS